MAYGLIFIAFVLRLYQLDFQSLWRDEVDAIRFSSSPFVSLNSGPAMIATLIRRGHNGPLFFLVLHGWRRLTGDSEFALRYFSLLAGVLMVPLTYRVARQFGVGLKVALIAAGLVATSPYAIWYAQEAKMYTWLTCLVLVAIWAYQSALYAQQSGGWWVLFVLAASLSFYTHILSPLMLFVYLVWGVLVWEQLQIHWRGWLLSMGLLTLPYLPLLLWQADFLQQGIVSGHPYYPLLQQVRLLLQLYSSGILQTTWATWGILLTLFLVLIGGIAPLSLPGLGHCRGARWQLMLWFLLPTLFVHLISLRVHIFEDRYLIYLLPAYYLLMAIGLVVLWSQSAKLASGLLILLVTLNLWSGWRQAHSIIKTDFRGAGAYLYGAVQAEQGCNRQKTTVIFQMPYLQHTFDYYYPGESYQAIEGLWTNDGRSAEGVARDMARLTADLQTVWLVLSEAEQWDDRQLVQQWLSTQATLVQEASFARVKVAQYRFGPAPADPLEISPPPQSSMELDHTIFLPLVVCSG